MARQAIVGFHQDEEEHWVAQLGCGHSRHVRHTPPWQMRPWVISESGRAGKLGYMLECVKCERKAPVDGDWFVSGGKR